jgi:hypothetical protein
MEITAEMRSDVFAHCLTDEAREDNYETEFESLLNRKSTSSQSSTAGTRTSSGTGRSVSSKNESNNSTGNIKSKSVIQRYIKKKTAGSQRSRPTSIRSSTDSSNSTGNYKPFGTSDGDPTDITINSEVPDKTDSSSQSEQSSTADISTGNDTTSTKAYQDQTDTEALAHAYESGNRIPKQELDRGDIITDEMARKTGFHIAGMPPLFVAALISGFIIGGGVFGINTEVAVDITFFMWLSVAGALTIGSAIIDNESLRVETWLLGLIYIGLGLVALS